MKLKTRPIDRPALLFLVAFMVVTLTILEPLMAWVIVLVFCICGILLYKVFRPNSKRIKNRMLNLFAIFCIAVLVFFSSDYGLLNTMINLLMVACCLKMINLHRKADYQAVSITLMFLVACGMIFHQEIAYTVLYCIIVCLLFIILNSTEFANNQTSVNSRYSFPILLQALPIAILLFLVTPKLPPLWQVPQGKGTETGLAEEITPGDIANLAQSDDLVFRAEFEGELPSNSERYWRAIVLDYFDGKTWSIQTRDPQHYDWNEESVNRNDTQRVFEYVVIAEPSTTQWLYSIDIPNVVESTNSTKIKLKSQYQLSANSPLYTQTLYGVRSYPDLTLTMFNEDSRKQAYMQLPAIGNERTQTWVKENINDELPFEQKLAKLQSLFLNGGFEYTLKPPFMPNNPIDTFLFDDKRGFCSHYASAFAYMLRLAGIPSRLVTGYQGGEEQINNVLSIYQFDAHAWVEALHPTQGWLRYDPTALIAPNRIAAGLRDALQNQDEFMEQNPFSLAKLQDFPIFGGLRQLLETLDYNWSQQVLGFNQETQKSMIKDIFGEINARIMSIALAIAFISIAVFLAVVFTIKSYRPKDPFQSLNNLFMRKTAKLGLKKEKHETMGQFINRVSASKTNNALISEQKLKPLVEFQRQYEALVYAKTHYDEADIKSLKRLLSKL
jgi:transglutaminase-like putative cysteine protease